MASELLTVDLDKRSYPILIGRNLANDLSLRVREDLDQGRKVVLITDENVFAAQKELRESAFAGVPVLALQAGESTKSFANLEKCCDFLAASGLDRSGRLFAMGGGVIGDLAGFAAASYYRGIGFYQVPTSVLAMVDSSVGGKTGINLECGKNLVGAFHQPLAVYSDLNTLQSLPPREFNSGMAEVIKHGLLADSTLFEDLESWDPLSPASEQLPDVIRRNCQIKAAVVSADEKEKSATGGRALLNLGHTFGHAIEAVAGYGTYLHGEAIAIGLVLAARLSAELGNLASGDVGRISGLLEKYDLPVSLNKPLDLAGLLAAARKDKKARAGRMRYVVMRTIGDAVTVDDVDENLVRALWKTVM